ncbi:MAG: hypothetical protein H3C69_02370, partial [Candidatus Promineofilum sp.]|nr:hypothetical protein [Promineifilum sp.]
AYEEIELGLPDVLAYRRTHPGSDGFVVVLNFGDDSRVIDLDKAGLAKADIVLSTDPDADITRTTSNWALAPNTGVLFRLVESD